MEEIIIMTFMTFIMLQNAKNSYTSNVYFRSGVYPGASYDLD